ncbi:MAG: serine/threonine protein phosphatase [Anaerolineae bacterium]|nr:serine/threonine protein phosphatase [Anaerolineae bacterium]
MGTSTESFTHWRLSPAFSKLHAYDIGRALAYRRLDAVFQNAPTVAFDDATPLIFFSDCHRGDNSRADAFSVNEPLFLHALHYYYQRGFTYVEVGDGDELWKNRRFHTVKEAHSQVFDRLHRFDDRQRLHLLLGNHDIWGAMCRQMNKDGLIAREGLILKHRQTGQQLYVTHGHQADFKSDRLYRFSRMAVRNVWRRLQLWGMAPVASPNGEERAPHPFERFLFEWAALHRRLLICGHTHRPVSATYGAPPYFNTGHCVAPGLLTGVEIRNGEIGLVRWRATPWRSSPCQREVLSEPRRLKYFD